MFNIVLGISFHCSPFMATIWRVRKVERWLFSGPDQVMYAAPLEFKVTSTSQSELDASHRFSGMTRIVSWDKLLGKKKKDKIRPSPKGISLTCTSSFNLCFRRGS